MTTRPIHTTAIPGQPSCSVIAQIRCRGAVETSVFAVTAMATQPGGAAHIGVKFGKLLCYIEDRTALEALAGAISQALDMAGGVFGPSRDAFTEVERTARRRFERTGDAAALR